jgi:16S rRNA G966 N2-methylase RsmD
MKYRIIRNTKYDFAGQSYATSYPNLHRYPATMIPQIGIEIFKELKINSGTLLDPYCGSGSSFIVGLERGIKEMEGFDLNPLAILISHAKFKKININELKRNIYNIKNKLIEYSSKKETDLEVIIPNVYNIEFWFSKKVIKELSLIKLIIKQIEDSKIRRFILVPFSETIRECSYTRNGEFKLFRMKEEDRKKFNPDTFTVFLNKLDKAIKIYEKYYFPLLNGSKLHLGFSHFPKKENYYDIVLTSPPYGDSRTTVAYGQFSVLTNEWLDITDARKIDSMLMGGKISKEKYSKGILANYINEIEKVSPKRALEISAFYYDLEESIKNVASSVKQGGKIIYVVGNRMVKDVVLPTDQFIAEKFEENDFRHLLTYERVLGNKSMPSLNSPSNQSGIKRSTMTKEYIIICEKAFGPENWVVCDKTIIKKKTVNKSKVKKSSKNRKK